MKNVLLTGHRGIIGAIISKGLKQHYKLTTADLPEVDLRDYDQVLKTAYGQHVIVHLGWNSETENFKSKSRDPDNASMYSNIFKAALEEKVPRVIMASSVHADNFRGDRGEGLFSPIRRPHPACVYGEDKVDMENLGRACSHNGLEVACVRFGAVGGEKPTDAEGEILWLTESDCVSLVRAIIDVPSIPHNFAVVYGISDNVGRIHDLSNPFGWVPREGFKQVRSYTPEQ